MRTGRVTLAMNARLFGEPALAARVLDIGAGDSPFVAELAVRENFAVALDGQYLALPPWPGGVAVAADANYLPFRSGVFSEVHASYLLMHLTDRRTALTEMVRVASLDARLCLAPVWNHRIAYRRLLAMPGVLANSSSLWPHRRASLELRLPVADLDIVVSQIAAVTAPAPPIQWLSRPAMRLVVGLKGDARFDTTRLFRKRSRAPTRRQRVGRLQKQSL